MIQQSGNRNFVFTRKYNELTMVRYMFVLEYIFPWLFHAMEEVYRDCIFCLEDKFSYVCW